MSFDLVDAYVAIIDLNEKVEYLASILIEKGIIPRPKEEAKPNEKIKKGYP